MGVGVCGCVGGGGGEQTENPGIKRETREEHGQTQIMQSIADRNREKQ